MVGSSQCLEVLLGLALLGLILKEVLGREGGCRLELMVTRLLLACAFDALRQEVVAGLVVPVRVQGGIIVYRGILVRDDHLVRQPRALMDWGLFVCGNFSR